MKVTWLGQAGLLFETNGLKIMVDPYLSDSVKKITPAFYRRVPVDQSLFDIKPDVIILTHNHLDHADPETLPHFLTENSSVLVLASYNAWQTARTFKGNNNYVSFNRNTEWTEKGVRFKAVYAEHSDDHAIGVVIFAEDKTYYVTGDTLYNETIFDDLPSKIDYVFLPVNGVGNNMNFIDGARFCTKLNAKAVPMHCGLFDEINLSDFPYENKVVPKFYKEINL
jgi:L-ascorbate metabolism protein UlaG (beta-lactamase superfamily)